MVAMPPWSKEKVFSGPASQHTIFRIENDEVLDILRLEEPSGLRDSLDEIRPRLKELFAQAERVKAIDPKNMNLADAKILELAKQFKVFQQLATYEMPQGYPSSRRPYEQWRPLAD